jgi:hypothetical protein
MKTIILILALTASAHAQLSFLGRNGPDGVCRIENGAWQCYPQQHSVPEPSSPLVMLITTGLALIGRRSRKPGRGKWIREKRIDLRTVRIL